jgi:hypothetical protein
MKRFNIKEWQDNYLNEADDISTKTKAFADWLGKNARMMKWSQHGNTLSKKQDFANAPKFDVKTGILDFDVNFVLDHSNYMGDVESQSDQSRTAAAKAKKDFIRTPMFKKAVTAYKKIFGKAVIYHYKPDNIDIWKHDRNHSRFAQWRVLIEVSPK